MLLIWSGIDMALYLKSCSIHPGLRVTLDLIFWLLSLGGAQSQFGLTIWIKSMSPVIFVFDILVMYEVS